jgi:CcmD family protein
MSNKTATLTLLFTILSEMLNAQSLNPANTLMENSKLNAVIAVAAVILLGIFFFLFYLERKIKKLEEEVKN